MDWWFNEMQWPKSSVSIGKRCFLINQQQEIHLNFFFCGQVNGQSVVAAMKMIHDQILFYYNLEAKLVWLMISVQLFYLPDDDHQF